MIVARFSATVVDHFTNPRNCGRISEPDVAAFVGNPVCGDQILLTARISEDAFSEIRFEAYGCSASLAIASLLTERLVGMSLEDVSRLEAETVAAWSGGLLPEGRHVADLGAAVAHRLVDNWHSGVRDDVEPS